MMEYKDREIKDTKAEGGRYHPHNPKTMVNSLLKTIEKGTKLSLASKHNSQPTTSPSNVTTNGNTHPLHHSSSLPIAVPPPLAREREILTSSSPTSLQSRSPTEKNHFNPEDLFMSASKPSEQGIAPWNITTNVDDEGEPLPNEKRLVMCERERCKHWAEEFNLEIVLPCEQLSGFKLYVVEEWIFDPVLLYTVLVEYTGLEEDKIWVAVAKPKTTITPAQRMVLDSVFFNPTTPGVRAKETPLGTIVVTHKDYSYNDLTLICIPDGDYEKYIPILTHQVTLKRLSCGVEPISLGREPQASMEHNFCEMYEVSSSTPLMKAAETIVEQLQGALKHLHYLSAVAAIDGVFTNATVDALKNFQKDLNATLPENQRVPENGHLTPDIFKTICDKVRELKQKLDKLGFHCSGDPIKNHTEMTQVIKLFQMSKGLYADGSVDQKTLSEIDRLVEEADKQKSNMNSEAAEEPSPVESPKDEHNAKFKVDPFEEELLRRLSALTTVPPTTKTDTLVKSKDVFKNIEPRSSSALAGKLFVSCERERCKNWASEMGLLIVNESEQLSGFRLYVIEEWVFDSDSTRCVIQSTGHPNDKILVTVLKPKPTTSDAQEKFLRKYFLPSESNQFVMETQHGSVLCYRFSTSELKRITSPLEQSVTPSTAISLFIQSPDELIAQERSKSPPPQISNELTYLHIPDGDFDKHISTIKLQLALRRLGCGYYTINLGDPERVIAVMDQKLRALYAITPSITTSVAVKTLTKEIQAALVNLKFLPANYAVNGVYNGMLVNAVKSFQRQNQIKPTGYLSGATYQALYEKIMAIKAFLEQNGFPVATEDPFKDYELFSRVLQEYMETEKKRQTLFHKQSQTPPSLLFANNANGGIASPQDDTEKQKLMLLISSFQSTIEKQAEACSKLEEDYEVLEKSYSKLKEEAQEALAKVDLYKIQLHETKKAFNILNHEYTRTNEILREHNDTIQSYMVKINRLEEKVLQLQRANYRNFISSFFITLLTWLLSLVAVIILCVTTGFDYIKKLTHGSDKDSVSFTKRMKAVLLRFKGKMIVFAEDFGIIEKDEHRYSKEELNLGSVLDTPDNNNKKQN